HWYIGRSGADLSNDVGSDVEEAGGGHGRPEDPHQRTGGDEHVARPLHVTHGETEVEPDAATGDERRQQPLPERGDDADADGAADDALDQPLRHERDADEP